MEMDVYFEAPKGTYVNASDAEGGCTIMVGSPADILSMDVYIPPGETRQEVKQRLVNAFGKKGKWDPGDIDEYMNDESMHQNLTNE